MPQTSMYQPVRSAKESLSDQVADQIIELIAHKQLEAGTRLPSLEDLTRYLEVSRTAVREAIKLLDAWGVVTVKHGVGPFVADMAGDALRVPFRMSAERHGATLRNLFQIRESLEPDIAAIAAQNATPEKVNKLEEALQWMERAQDDPEEFDEADLAFHTALATATGNYLFLIVINPIIGLIQDMMHLMHRVPGTAQRGLPSHRMVFQEVKAGSPTEARKAMHAHLLELRRDIEALSAAED